MNTFAKSELFTTKNRRKIETAVINLLNSNQLMNRNTVNSPRAVGDAVQSFLESNIDQCLPKKLIAKINSSFARRSMADLAFDDTNEKIFSIQKYIDSLKNER